MAFVRVEQRNGRLAAAVRIDTVRGREGPLVKGTVTVISNVRRGSGEGREEEATSIQWTLWGKLAENAAEYLSKGSRVNVVGRFQNNTYQDANGGTVYGLTFTCEELDYLDSRQEAEARRAKQVGAPTADEAAPATEPSKANGRSRPASKAAKARSAATATAGADDDIPF
jgi:single-strand DNA-binding protein